MIKTLTTIVLRRKQAVLITHEDFNNPPENTSPLVASMCANLGGLGFIPTEELVSVLNSLEEAQLMDLYPKMIESIKSVYTSSIGFDSRPLFPQFPKNIMGVDESELYLDALLHYITDGTYKPSMSIEDHDFITSKYFEKVNVARKLGYFNTSDLEDMVVEIMTSNGSLSDQDKEDLVTLSTVLSPIIGSLALDNVDNISIKETSMFVAGILVKLDDTLAKDFLTKSIKTATDVLRFATVLSDGDVSLATNTKFVNIPRKYRKVVMNLMSQMNLEYVAEDLVRHKEKWKRLAEKIHPGEYDKQYPRLVLMFKHLRDGDKIETFNSKVEKSILEKDFLTAIETLSQRPGELMRRVDKIVREAGLNEIEALKHALSNTAKSVSTPVIIQLIGHLKSRVAKTDTRLFLPKGSISKAYSIENTLEPLDFMLVSELVSILATQLTDRFSELEGLGNVYLDPKLKKIPVPLAQRSASSQARTVPRGSRIPLTSGGNVIRLFTHWKQKNQRADVDLSAVFYDEDWNVIEKVWYGDLKSKRLQVSHSGDYVSTGPEGATEYIDIPVNICLENKVKYVAMSINNFSGLMFSEMTECFAGFMSRDSVKSGEVFDLKTVEQKFDLTSEAKDSLPMVFDLETREMVWIDLAKPGSIGSNVINGANATSTIVKAAVEDIKFSLFDLFYLHVLGRGNIVTTVEEADISFGLTGDVTPYDISKILSEYVI